MFVDGSLDLPQCNFFLPVLRARLIAKHVTRALSHIARAFQPYLNPVKFTWIAREQLTRKDLETSTLGAFGIICNTCSRSLSPYTETLVVNVIPNPHALTLQNCICCSSINILPPLTKRSTATTKALHPIIITSLIFKSKIRI